MLDAGLSCIVQLCVEMLPDAAEGSSSDGHSSRSHADGKTTGSGGRAGTSSSSSFSSRSSQAVGGTGSSSGDRSSSSCNIGREASTTRSICRQDMARASCALVAKQLQLVQQVHRLAAAGKHFPALIVGQLKPETGDVCLQLLHALVTVLHGQHTTVMYTCSSSGTSIRSLLCSCTALERLG